MANSTTKTTNRSIASSVAGELADLGKQTAKTGWNSISGRFPQNPTPSEPNNYDGGFDSAPMPPERMGIPGMGKKKEKPREVEVFSFAQRKEHIETSSEIEKLKELVNSIKQEVRQIEEQNKSIITESAKISVEQLPDKPGIYHIRFFEWLLNMLRDIRKKVTESASWLSVAQGKKQKGYWGMAKKKGTSFTLSGERTPSTQSG